MATKDEEKKDAPSAAREAAREAADSNSDAETYDHEWLIGAAASFGFLPENVAGALSAVTKKNLTIEEAAEVTKKWLSSPVKTEA